VKALLIEPGNPCESSYIESLNGKLRDNLLEREHFDTLLVAEVLIKRLRQFNAVRPHNSWIMPCSKLTIG
jgi:putative transposase